MKTAVAATVCRHWTGPRHMQVRTMYDSLTDELLIGSRESQHELCPRAQSKDVQGVHELPEM